MIPTELGEGGGAPKRYRFGDVVVDEAAHTLQRADAVQPVEPKAFAVLLALLQRPGELVEREHLLDRVWGHRHVTPGVLTRAIAQLRQALADDPQRPRYIQTQHALGYRFMGTLETDAGLVPVASPVSRYGLATGEPPQTELCSTMDTLGAAPTMLESVSQREGQAPGFDDTLRVAVAEVRARAQLGIRWRWIAAGAGLTVLVAAGFLLLRRDLLVATPADPSIAVLPFTTLSDDRTDRYFAEGLAVEMHDALSSVPGIKVAARTSLGVSRQGRDIDVRTLGRTLGVATVLDASVRRDGAQVRINARLSDTRTGFTLWTDGYDRKMSDVFAMQSEIANKVVKELLGVLPGERDALAKRLAPTKNIAAYESYLKGLDRLKQPGASDNLVRAVSFFNEALAADTGFARAQAGICRAEIQRFENGRDADAYRRAETACLRAAEMDPGLHELSLAFGDLYRVHGEPAKAIAQYNKALENPALAADAYIGIARTHGAHGRQQLAMQYFERARGLRPGDDILYRHLGYQHYLNGDLAKAIESYRKATTLMPGDAELWSSLGGLYTANGNTAHAVEAFKRSLAIKPSYEVLSNLGTLRYEARDYDEAAKLYRYAAQLNPDDYRIWGNIGDALSAWPATAAQARAPYQRAVKMAERYTRIKSDDAHALATLAWYRANLGDAAVARELISRAEALGTKHGEVALCAAQTLALLGDADAARERVQRARTAGIPMQRIASSPVLARLGRTDSAKTRI